jgi:hypothetical protein
MQEGSNSSAEQPDHATGNIQVVGNAVGSALITGDGNIVTIVYGANFVRSDVSDGGKLIFEGNPYCGLSAFDENYCDRFFCR